MKFDLQHGVALLRGATTIIHGIVVKNLLSGEMTAEAYRKMLQDIGIS